MEQLAPAASVAPQALLPVAIAKAVGLAPPIVIPLIVSEALPVLLIVADSAAEVAPTVVLGKAAGEVSEAMGAAGVVPVPARPAPCGEPAALSATESVAAKLAAEAGLNVTDRKSTRLNSS